MIRIASVLLLMVLQSAPAFEVATVKPDPPDATTTFAGGSCHGIDNQSSSPLGRCVFRHWTLSSLMVNAYGMQAVGGPAWVSSDMFWVDAKAEHPETTTLEQLRLMLRALLADRFKVEFHREKRDVQGFVLSAAPGGIKLKPSTATERDIMRLGPDGMTGTNVHMPRLMGQLGALLRGPVTDETGLTEGYDFKWAVNRDPDANGDSIFRSIEESGLKLEPRKLPVEMIVIDRAEKPRPQ